MSISNFEKIWNISIRITDTDKSRSDGNKIRQKKRNSRREQSMFGRFRIRTDLALEARESFEEDEVYIRWAYSLEPEHMINQIKQRHKGKKIYITEGNLFKGNSTGKDFIQSKKVPKIMARITNLAAWGDILQGKNDFTFRILVKDPYIKDQNGVFQFQCLNHKISIQRADIPQDETLDIHTTDAQGWEDEISIDELTQVFFDYDAGQILKEHEYLKDIVPAGPIYISEEV